MNKEQHENLLYIIKQDGSSLELSIPEKPGKYIIEDLSLGSGSITFGCGGQVVEARLPACVREIVPVRIS
jgi:hypothetical protein